MKTRTARLRRAIESVSEFCRRQRHKPIAAQQVGLARRINGHINYFGVQGNFRSLVILVEESKRLWYKWLTRRSQRSRLNWERFKDLIRDFPLPRPRIRVRIWANSS